MSRTFNIDVIGKGSILERVSGVSPLAYTPDYGAPFIFTIDTSLGNGISALQLPLRSGFAYDFIIDWGDGSQDSITTYNQAETNHTYASGGLYQISIRGLCQTFYFNNGGDKDKLISIDKLGSVGWTSMERAFYGCVNNTFVGDGDLSNVTNCGAAWYNNSLTEWTIDLPNVINC